MADQPRGKDAAAEARARAETARKAADEAEAEARAAEAAAAEPAAAERADPAETAPTAKPTEEEPATGETAREPVARPPRVGGRSAVSAPVAVLSVLTLALLAVSGFFGYTHWKSERDARERTEILDAARQGVVDLTTMNFEEAEQDVQRVLDGSAGEFHDEFEARSKDLIAVMQEAKVQSEGEVTQAAIENQGGDSADVLVAVAQKVSNAGGAVEEPRGQRMRVTVQLQDGQYKIVKAGFVQ